MREHRRICGPIGVTAAMRVTVALFFLFWFTAVFGVYYQPTRRLVLNEVLPSGSSQVIRLPLYLTRRGSYFVELFLEPSSGSQIATATGPPAQTRLSFTITILHRDKVLVSKAFELTLAPGEPAETLFWMESPWDVPDRRDLQVIVDFNDGGTGLHPADRLRLQIQRKPNLYLFGR